MLNKINKKAQLSEGLTFTVATIIIIVLSVVFIFLSGLIGKYNLEFFSVNVENSILSEQEMLFSILESKIEGKTIREMIENNEIEKARQSGIDKTLSFKQKGIECVFNIREVSGDEKNVRVIINGKEVSLSC